MKMSSRANREASPDVASLCSGGELRAVRCHRHTPQVDGAKNLGWPLKSPHTPESIPNDGPLKPNKGLGFRVQGLGFRV